MYFEVYANKTAAKREDFLNRCMEFFPFYISHILTDNGGEFTDKFTCGKNEPSGSHKFDQVCTEHEIDQRLTLPATPSTNGMVERVNATIKDKTILVNTYANVDEEG